MKSLRRLILTVFGAAALLGVASGQVPGGAASFEEGQVPDLAMSPVAPPAAAADVSADVLELRTDLERLVRAATSRSSVFGVLIVSLDRGDTLFSLNPDRPVAPASNMKLFTTAAALYYLGPNFRYSTYALADGEIRDSVLDGDLVLYGTGDPAISSRILPGSLVPLRALADSLRAQGIKQITGDVVGDGSYFDDQWIAEGWRDEYRLATYSAPVGALSLGENIVTIRVMPGAVGGAAQIRTTPATEGLLIQNRVRTVASGSSSVRFSYDPSGLVIEGQLTRRHPGVARTVTVVDPANFAGAAFRSLLEDAGIEVGGTVRSIRSADDSPIGRSTRSLAEPEAQRPPPRVLGTHMSPTLAELVNVANHVSQNLYAEAFFKTVGRVALGDGSFAGGSRAVEYFLECESPVDFTNIRIVDGSGLSPIDRVTPRAMIHLLDTMTRTDVWETFLESLPEAASTQGGSHTLRSRMGGTPAARNLRAKTGTISNVSSLSGYVTAANGERIAFSIIGNELPSTWQAKRMEDGMGARLARFTRPDATVATPIATPPVQVESQPGVEAPSTEPALGEEPATAPASETPPAVPSAPATTPPASTPAARPATAAPRTHRVVSGETLDGIARRYGTTVVVLQRLNPRIQPRRLQVGQTVTLPAR